MMMTASRRRFLLAATAGMIALPAMASARTAHGRRQSILPWEQLRPGIWATPTTIPGGNVLIASGSGIRGRGEAIVIDSKFASVSGAILRDAQHFTNAPPERTALINTHHHADHTSGNASFTLAGSRIIAHHNAMPRIADQIERYRLSAANAIDDARAIDADNQALLRAAEAESLTAGIISPAHVLPLVGVGDTAQVAIGADRRATLHHFGTGHTDNDLVVHFPDANVVHAGDLVFNGMHPFFDPSANVTARGWIRSLNALEQLCDDDTIVVPGHGQVGDINAVRNQRAYLEQLVEAVAAEQQAGKGKDETVDRVFPFMMGLSFEQIRPRAISAVWDELDRERQ